MGSILISVHTAATQNDTYPKITDFDQSVPIETVFNTQITVQIKNWYQTRDQIPFPFSTDP